jgi:hypothetical protein
MHPTRSRRRAATLAAFALSALGLAPLAGAHPDRRPGPHVTAPDARGRYRAYDRDRDGRLERDEVDAYWADEAARFGAFDPRERALLVEVAPSLDVDHDGRLERRELRAWRTLVSAQRELRQRDTNHSGRLNPSEAVGSRFFATRMGMLDLDRNGRVQPDELTAGVLEAYRHGPRAFERQFGDHSQRAIYIDRSRRHEPYRRDGRLVR